MAREYRVYGPPGCGKTTWLARQAERAAKKYGGGAVCVASLTKTAAAEVAGRRTSIPPQNIGTLHAHAYRALKFPDIMEVKGLKAWNEWVPIARYRLTAKAAASPEAAPMEMVMFDTEGDELLNEMSILRARMTPLAVWPMRVRAFREYWIEFKEARGFLDFTDLIEQAIRDTEKPPSEPQVLMLDEAQDMSLLEMTLARQWGENCEDFIIVGDPDQNLYEWRGSDPNAFTAGEAEGEIVLEQSYRVPRAVRDVAKEWIEQIPERKQVVYEPREGDEGEVAQEENLSWDNGIRVVDAIEEELAQGKKVMVLTSCGYMLHPVTDELRRRGQPFWNPYRPTWGPWNPMRAAGRLLAFLRPSRAVWGDEARAWTWGDVKSFTEPMQAQGYMKRGSKEMLKSKNLEDRFGESASELPAFDAVFGGTIFEEEHLDALFEMDVRWWEESLRHGERPKQVFPLAVYRERGGRALIEDPTLVVGSIHSVKGGEADTVFLFPDLSMAGWDQWIKGYAGKWAIVRQFYVGMTRAREKLVLCGPSGESHVPWL